MSQKYNLPLKEIKEIFQSKDKNQLHLFKRGSLSFPFKNPDALWRYAKLLHGFHESLLNIKDMCIYKDVVKIRTLFKVVMRYWYQLRKHMRKLVQVSFIL